MPQKYSFLLLFLLISSFAAADEQFPFLGQVTGEGVNIRAGQSANFEKIGRLKSGDKIVTVDKSYSWYKIKLPVDAKSYISLKYIKELDPAVGEVTTDRVNIRAGAGEQFSILGQAAKGQHVRILEKREGWYKIEPIEESFGWITEDYLKYYSKEIPPARIVEMPLRNIYVRRRLARENLSENPAPGSATNPVEEKRPIPVVFSTGIVEDLAGEAIAKDIRQVINGDNNASYYLKGPPEIMDVFLHQKVAMEGILQPDITAPRPVILIKKINLVL